MNNKTPIETGHQIYNRFVLSVYDWWVLGFSNSLLWRCPTKLLREVFVKNATTNHLDVGVGTGYYLNKCFGNIKLRLALLDINQNSLNSAAAKVSRFQPEIYRANVLRSFDMKCDRFDSISLFYLLHCIPGKFADKTIIFDNLRPYLNESGVVFGTTILGKGVKTGYFARALMNMYNKKGIFNNKNDSLDGLSSCLQYHFEEVNIQTIGCVAIFSCKTFIAS
jgi:hypothetical protein